MLILLVLLCFLIPPIAVGLKTNWDLTKLLISIILTLLFLVPGVIYALLVVFDVI
ncbi:MAG: YqaE/Pmp3 family membrane protein [Flavobacteriia bacterium]|nr:YqaE/Pmp3 family membrane protein [Flavobacteriia bacterium]